MNKPPSIQGAPKDLQRILQRIPAFLPWFNAGETATWRMLTGGTRNKIYHITWGTGRAAGQQPSPHAYVIRIPGYRSKPKYYAVEAGNMALAAEIGIAPSPLYFDESHGVLIYPYLEGNVITKKYMQNESVLDRLVATLHALHSLKRFSSSLDVFEFIDQNVHYMDELGVERFGVLNSMVWEISRLRPPLEKTAPPPCPCHNDPLPANAIDMGGNIVLIDWEYSGMGDPHTEVADWIINGDLSEALENHFLNSYLGGDDTVGHHRVRLMKAASAFSWVVHHSQRYVDSEPRTEKGLERIRQRLKQCRRFMNDPQYDMSFKELLRTASKGIKAKAFLERGQRKNKAEVK